jgi:hypothetical protein
MIANNIRTGSVVSTEVTRPTPDLVHGLQAFAFTAKKAIKAVR